MSERAEVAVAPPGAAARGPAWPRPLLVPLAWTTSKQAVRRLTFPVWQQLIFRIDAR